MEQKIREILKEGLPDVDFESSDQLVEDGLIDSLVIAQIIAVLSEKFGVEIPLEEIVPENFNNIADMARMIEKLQ